MNSPKREDTRVHLSVMPWEKALSNHEEIFLEMFFTFTCSMLYRANLAWRDVQDLGYKKAVFGLLLDDSDTWQFLEI